jgi:hypothetical protein
MATKYPPRKPRPSLWIPPSSSIHGERPKFRCHICQDRDPGAGLFYSHAAYVAHFEQDRCKDLETEIRMRSFTLRAPGFFDPWYEGSDVEWGKFIERKWKERPEQWRKWMRTGLDK